MKRNSSKRQRRKNVPLCFQKKNLSKSNTSLSQLLSIGSYKRRINELVRNNRDLAVALQDARCETAYQSNLLKDCARENNQIIFARLKLKEMAKTITKLVTDLDEVVHCLEVDLPSDKCNLLQKNRSSHDRMRIKAPTVDCIEEVSVLSSETEEGSERNGPQSGTSDELPSHKSLDKAENTYEIQPSTSSDLAVPILDMPPVLFVDDSKEKDMEGHGRSKSSKTRSNDQTSLTPELDIDFPCFSRKRSSSRRLTQLIPLAPSSTRSRNSRRASVLNLSSREDATPKRNLSCSEAITLRKLSSVLMDYEQDSEENKNPAFVNTKERGSKNASCSPEDLTYPSLHITDHDVDFSSPSDAPLTVVPEKATANTFSNNECTQYNHTVLLSDDMELTDVVPSVKQIISGGPPTTRQQYSSNIQSNVQIENRKIECASKSVFEFDGLLDQQTSEINKTLHFGTNEPPDGKSETPQDSKKPFNFCEETELYTFVLPSNTHEITATSNVPPLSKTSVLLTENDENEFDGSREKICCDDEIAKLTENAKSVAIIHKDKYPNVIENENDDVFQNGETFECVESLNKNHSVSSHCTRSSRNKKNVKYKLFFSNSESESDSTPVKPDLNEMKYNRTQRETVIFKPKSGKKISNIIANCQSDDKNSLKEQNVNKVSLNAFSVYDLDVSNSEKQTKKSRLKSKTKKYSHNKEITKPLLQNCNVTKLKGVNYKFTKNENSISKVQENQQLQNCKSLLESNSTTSVNDTVTQSQQNLPLNNRDEDTDTKTENRNSVSSNRDENLASDFKHEKICVRTPKSGRRVSFATTDLVCNFTKMSLSKAIADNRKIKRASKSVSKSVFEFDGLLDQQTSEIKTTLHFEINESPDGKSETPCDSNEPFNFCEETELYKFILPSDTHEITATANEPPLSKTIVSSVTVSPIMYDSSVDPNFKESQLTDKNKSEKLSLKRNKNSPKKVKPPTSGKVDRNVFSESLSSNSSVVQPKHKSSCKMLSPDDVKENIHNNSETLDIPQAETQIKSKISTKSHLPPVDSSDVLVPIDDIKIVTKSSRKKGTLSQKHKLLQPTSGKTSRKSIGKVVESSPVLKDVMNLEGKTEGRDSMKRRTKVVNYKEASLNKKLRRE